MIHKSNDLQTSVEFPTNVRHASKQRPMVARGVPPRPVCGSLVKNDEGWGIDMQKLGKTTWKTQGWFG